jgi:glycyl-tRNA synthetase (class II)
LAGQLLDQASACRQWPSPLACRADLRHDRRDPLKLYRRQDEIGTLCCITVDVDTLDDNAVTIRDRDSMTQERVPVEGVKRAILDRMEQAPS